MAGVIADESRADAEAFLARLLRLAPAAVVRLRPLVPRPAPPGLRSAGSAATGATGEGGAETAGAPARAERAPSSRQSRVLIWARLPFDPLVSRGLVADVDRDVTVRASELLAAVGAGRDLPAARDADWRWPLPPPAAEDVEEVPAAEILRIAAAAADTAREALGSGVGGRAVGSRRVRDALLDHVPIVVESGAGAGAERIEVPQRLVQAVVRMSFVKPDGRVVVRRAGAWVGLAGEFGAAWHRPIGESLNLHVSPYRTNG